MFGHIGSDVSSLQVIVVLRIAAVTQAVGIGLPLTVLAVGGSVNPTKSVVAVVAHTFCVVQLVLVPASADFAGLSSGFAFTLAYLILGRKASKMALRFARCRLWNGL